MRPRSVEVFLSGRREIATAASARSSSNLDVGAGKIADAEQMAVRVERRQGGVGHLKAAAIGRGFECRKKRRTQRRVFPVILSRGPTGLRYKRGEGLGIRDLSGSMKDDCVTDEVTNQPPPLYGHQCLARRPACWCSSPSSFPAPVKKDLDGLGRFVLSPEAQDLARLANTETPKLRTHDRQGRRIDLVEFHPAYHALMRRSIAGGLHSSIWENGAEETGKRHQVAGRALLPDGRARMRPSLPASP